MMHSYGTSTRSNAQLCARMELQPCKTPSYKSLGCPTGLSAEQSAVATSLPALCSLYLLLSHATRC